MESTPNNQFPTFNHLAISVEKELLGDSGRKDILNFFDSVFGFTEMPSMTKDHELLVLRVHSNEQFIYLSADDKPMKCPSSDHIGLSVQSSGQLYDIFEKAKSYQEKDSRVSIEGPTLEDFEVLKLHSFYVGYLLPMMVEIQCFEWQEGFDATSLPA
jgi:hypothetical protein